MARRGGITWVKNEVKPRLLTLGPKLDSAVATLFKYEEPKVQSYMRANAPWTDRTSNARNGLFAEAKSGPGKHVIVCYHTMPYGIWLEVANSGNYQIINPTISIEGKRVMSDLNKLLSRLGRAA